jgi:enoyl-CoA hydratase / 3-hydroxyacyl-CoA dehydrogenase
LPSAGSFVLATRLAPPDAIAVLGSGNMGSGIAQTCAQAGFSVRVRDLTDAQIARGRSTIEATLDGAIRRKKITAAQRTEILGRIQFTTNLGEAVRGAKLVIEAVFEEEAVKKAVFEEAAPDLDPSAIVATNTSSLSVSRLAKYLPNPSRFAGLHFFYPAPINKLLEIAGGESTSPDVLATLERFAYDLRKIPIVVKDSAGFCVNRFFVPYLNEATRVAEDGLGSWATIEEVGRELTGAANGPFELMNLTGTPIAFHSCHSLADAFGPYYDPTDLLAEQAEKKLPWDWRATQVEPDRKPAIRARFEGMLWGITTRLVEEGVASAEAVETGASVGLRWKNTPFAQISGVGVPAAYERVQEFGRRWGAAFPVSEQLRAGAARHETRWPLRLVRVERQGPVTWVLLDRPAVLNSLNSEVLQQLGATFQALASEPGIRAVVLAGAGPVFCAGADIAEMAAKGLSDGRAFGFQGQEVCRLIEEFPAPVIAFVEGYALGGGLEIALSADFIVASETAKLGLPEATIGIHPGFGGASRLTHLIGRARTKLVVYTATPMGAEEAARLGFVVRTFPPDRAREEAQALAALIASRAPLALAWVKSVINRATDGPLEGSLRLEGESAGHTFGTSDRTEGMAAFQERRPPKFEGK